MLKPTFIYLLFLLTIVLISACLLSKKKSTEAPAPALPSPDYSPYQKDLYIASSDTLPYRILFPENYDRSKKYPLVLLLHGAGERGTDNEKQLKYGASLFLKPENRRDYPCIVLAPQCPEKSYWSSRTIASTKDSVERTFNYENELKMGLRRAMELTRQVIRTESVDRNRVYITGLSMGGMGTFEAISRYPHLFAAAIPICGGGDLNAFTETTDNIPCWIFHGAADEVVPVAYSRALYARLRELNVPVKYTEYPGVNHNSWDLAFAEPELLKWLFSHRR